MIHFTLRRWQTGDEHALVKYANNYNIWKNVKDSFPHPYTYSDAEAWIQLCNAEQLPTTFAIEVDFEAVGGIGIILGQDIHRKTAEIGYWLGEPFWGQGIVTEAIREMTDYTLKNFDIHRIYAAIFEYNKASMKAIEKAGFVFETILKQACVKENQLFDEHVFVRFRE